MTRSTPRSSDSGNIMPASMTIMSSPSRRANMFMPNSPRPPSGMAVRDCEGLLKKEVSPQCNRGIVSHGRKLESTVENRRKGRTKIKDNAPFEAQGKETLRTRRSAEEEEKETAVSRFACDDN